MKFLKLLILAILCSATTHGQTLYGASPAKRGNSPYRGAIYWVNWDINGDSRPGDNIANNTVRTVTTANGILYTITISNVASPTHTNPGGGLLRSYVPGQWAYDDMKTGFNWFNAANQTRPVAGYDFTTGSLSTIYDNAVDAHNSTVGISNVTVTTPGNNPIGYATTFRVTVKAQLGATPLKVLGMVVVGAESLGISPSQPYYEFEQFTTNGDAWQAFSKVQNSYAGSQASASFKTLGDISNNGKTVLSRNSTGGGGNEGPGEMVWFSKSPLAGDPYVDVTLKGGGAQAVAIGFLGTYDYGDAPFSFGSVGHQLDVTFNGGVPPVGNNLAYSGVSLATQSQPLSTIGSIVDIDAEQIYSDNFKGDDTTGQADEDGIPNPYKSTVFLGESSVALSVNMKNTSGAPSNIWAWIDINKDGVFSANERSSPVVVNNGTNGPVSFTVSGLSTPFDAFTLYPMRLRLAQAIPVDNITTANVDESSFGVAVGGEVEDHLIKVLDAATTGKIFEDVNKNGLLDAGEALYTGSGMYVYLIDRNNKIVGKVPVVNGSYTIEGIPVQRDVSSLNARLMASAQNYQEGDVVTVAGAAPAAYSKTGEDLRNAGSNITNNGNNTDFIVGFTGTVPLAGIQQVNFGMYPLVLAVNFGRISSRIVGENLLLNWQTLKEENNSHFEVEISYDGVDFRKIATVKSKAINGNSGTSIDYEINNPLSDVQQKMATAFLGISIIGVALGFKKRKQRLLFTGMLILCAASLTGLSCKKANPEDIGNTKKVFVRILQVDLDGSTSYSKVVQAIYQQ